MVQKAFFGLFVGGSVAVKAALVSVLALLAGAGCVEPNPQPPVGAAGGPDICTAKFAGNCYEQGGGAGHDPADAGVGGESGSGGAGGSDPAGAGGSPAGSGGAGGSGDCVDGHGSTGPDGKECPNHGGAGGNAGSGASGSGAGGGTSGNGGSGAGAGGASGAGQGGAGEGGAAGGGGSDPAGAAGSSGSGQSGDGGQAGNGPAGTGGASGNGGDAGASGAGQSGAGQGGSSAGASGASASGAGGTGGAGQGGGTSGSGGSKAGAGGASGAGQSGAGQGGAGAGAGGSDPAGAGGSAGQAQLKPWGCKDFVVDTGFEDQQPTDDFSRWYQSMHVVGPYVFGGNSWGVDVLTKKDGAWTKIHVPESGNGIAWAAGPDKDGSYWFAATGTTGNPGLFKGQGQNWGLVTDAPLAYGYSRMVFTPDGTLYVLAGDGQARLWKRTPSGQWKDLIGNHPMKDMGPEGLAYVDGVVYVTAAEQNGDGTKFLAAHIYGYEGGKWVEIPSVASKAVRLSGLQPSGDHGLVASGAQADVSLQGGYRSVALFIALPSKAVTLAKEAMGFGYPGSLYSPRFGSYLATTQTVFAQGDGEVALYDGFSFVSLKPFPKTNDSVAFFLPEASGSAVFYQPVVTSGKAQFATAACGEL